MLLKNQDKDSFYIDVEYTYAFGPLVLTERYLSIYSLIPACNASFH